MRALLVRIKAWWASIEGWDVMTDDEAHDWHYRDIR